MPSRQRGDREDRHGRAAHGQRAARRAGHGDGARQHDIGAGQQAGGEAAHGGLIDGEERLREPDPHQGEARAHEQRAEGIHPLDCACRQMPAPSRHHPQGTGDEGPAQMIEVGVSNRGSGHIDERAGPELREHGHGEKAAGDQKHTSAEEREPGLEEFPAFFGTARRRSERDRHGAPHRRTCVRHDFPLCESPQYRTRWEACRIGVSKS